MNDRIYSKEQKENSLLPSEVIITQAPPNYQTHDMFNSLETLNFCTNSSSVSSTGSQNSEPLHTSTESCKGLNCSEKIATVIEVPAGIFGMIKLCLCKNCSIKFPQRRVIQ